MAVLEHNPAAEVNVLVGLSVVGLHAEHVSDGALI